MASKSVKKRKKNELASDDRNNTGLICKEHFFKQEEISLVHQSLLKWYDKNCRVMPWREIAKNEPDPNIRGYAVWVSEVMLQQTQVKTVIPYFEKWIQKWPTVKELAAAELEDINKVWSGLGYYARARNLWEGAKTVVDSFSGQIPLNPEELRTIPGIGRYTSCAIASVAFQKAVGVVDGNVIRVLTRLKVIGCEVSKTAVQNHLWKLVDEIVSRDRPGDFNQALMELGAVVCTPQSPRCSDCPVNEICLAYHKNDKNKLDSFLKNGLLSKKSTHGESPVCDIEDVTKCQFCLPKSTWESNPSVVAFPCKAKKKAPKEELIGVVVMESKNQVLMIKSSEREKGLLAGLWEFPSISLGDGSTDAIDEKFDTILSQFGVTPSILKARKQIGKVVHIFSHIHATYEVLLVVLNDRFQPKCGSLCSMILHSDNSSTTFKDCERDSILVMIVLGGKTFLCSAGRPFMPLHVENHSLFELSLFSRYSVSLQVLSDLPGLETQFDEPQSQAKSTLESSGGRFSYHKE